VLFLLFSINVVNYLDRLIVVAMGPAIKADFHLSDRTIGALSSTFLIVYTLAALPLGLLSDRVARARVVAIGLSIWSVMSGATAFTRGLRGLFITRSAVGIGEASYLPAGTALLSEYYPRAGRAHALSRWGSGQIVGTALAFVLSALFLHWFGPTRGWRLAFLVTAAPGFVLAVLMWPVREAPATRWHAALGPGASIPAPAGEDEGGVLVSVSRRLRQVLSIRSVWLCIILQACIYVVVTPTVTFLPIHLASRRSGFHVTDAQTAIISGVVIVVGGITGTLLGGYVSGWLSARLRGGRLIAVGISCLLGLPCFVGTVLTRSLPVFIVLGTLAVLTLSLQVGPLGAALQDVTPEWLRATAVASSLLLAHLLGDAWAPTVAGAISTSLGERTGLGLLYVGTPALLIAAIVGFVGARIYADDVAAQERADT
jgi:MFS family permease